MAGKSNKITMNYQFYNVINSILKFWLKRQFYLEANIPSDVIDLKPPYVILSNHQGFWDPFMIGAFIKQHIYFVATDAAFRSPFFKFIIQLVGTIPKTKAQSDLDALKNIIGVKQRGGIIGIFPESRRTWDGVTLPLLFSTAKLIRMLKIPVVTVILKGGYFSQPRWGGHIQKGKVVVDYKLLFSGDRLKSMKIDAIYNELTDALAHDEYKWQDEVSVEFRGKKPAEFLEQVLYFCPVCEKMGTMYSKGKVFKCNSCGYELEYNSLCRFESRKNKVIFNNIRDWSKWQQDKLYSFLDGSSNNKEILLEDKNLVFYTGYKSNKIKYFASGSLKLTANTLVFEDKNGSVIRSFPLKQLTGIDAQNKEKLEFYYEDVLYIIWSKHKHFSINKWLWAMEYLLKDKFSQFEQQ